MGPKVQWWSKFLFLLAEELACCLVGALLFRNLWWVAICFFKKEKRNFSIVHWSSLKDNKGLSPNVGSKRTMCSTQNLKAVLRSSMTYIQSAAFSLQKDGSGSSSNSSSNTHTMWDCLTGYIGPQYTNAFLLGSKWKTSSTEFFVLPLHTDAWHWTKGASRAGLEHEMIWGLVLSKNLCKPGNSRVDPAAGQDEEKTVCQIAPSRSRGTCNLSLVLETTYL